MPLLSAGGAASVLLVEWNDTAADYPRDKCLHELFAEQAAKTPDAVAVVYEDVELTYAELDRRSNQLAHHLRKLGVGPEVIVGLCVERSLRDGGGAAWDIEGGRSVSAAGPGLSGGAAGLHAGGCAGPVLVTQAGLVEQLPAHDWRIDADGTRWLGVRSWCRIGGTGPQNVAVTCSYTSDSTWRSQKRSAIS